MQFGSGNSHDRRKWRRKQSRIWESAPAEFAGEARINSDAYGVSYKNEKVTVLGKGKGYGTYIVQLRRRKSPLTVQREHLKAA